MIIHDATTLGSDWDKIKQYQINVVEFRRKGSSEKLTIVNANRTKIEETLGVDLIYYNHRFSSYVYADTFSEQELDVYRLSTEAFYFKFCPAINFDPLSTALIEGLYLPLNYLEILLKSSDAKGPKNGTSIASNRMKRFNNTLFAQLVQGGWIGSRLRNTGILTGLIQACINNDESVLFAYSESLKGTTLP